MVPCKVIPIQRARTAGRNARRKQQPAILRLWQGITGWMTAGASRGTVLLAGITAGLVFGAVVGAVILTATQINLADVLVYGQ